MIKRIDVSAIGLTRSGSLLEDVSNFPRMEEGRGTRALLSAT
jgi:hypothetical protein